jgi:hypothetical protein
MQRSNGIAIGGLLQVHFSSVASGFWWVHSVVLFHNTLTAPALQIRSVYRTIELSQGFEGHLSTIEAFFYGLDTLPLFLAIVVYIPFWPGRFIPSAVKPVDEEERQADSHTGIDEKV